MNELKTLIGVLALGITVSACFQVANSFSGDREAYSQEMGDKKFLAVRKVMQVSCARCHANDLMSFSEEDFQKKMSSQNRPYVVAKDLAQSELYQRLQGAGPRGDMPQNGTLSEAERDIFEEWIMGLQPLNSGTPVEALPPLETREQRWAAAHGIFSSPRCNSCHAQDLSVFSEDEFRNGLSLMGEPWIIPGDVPNSYLWRRLQGNGPEGNMPLDRPPPTDIEREIIRRWIEEMP